jgi:predicted ATPase
MIHLRSIRYLKKERMPDQYPFSLELIRNFSELTFTTPVTFFVGENGSGKSTLLEGIALASKAITIGSLESNQDASLEASRNFSKYLRTVWNQNTHKGFFLRAEDFFGYTRRLAQTKEAIRKELDSVQEQFANRSSYASDLAKLPLKRDLYELEQRYGQELEAASHGESFLSFFQSRFVPNGLYLLDEPEAALSPISQLAFITIAKQMVERNAQFIIATHSPILMAFPGATILNFDSSPIQPIPYEDVKHVEIMKNFLENPNGFLKYL